MSAKRRRAAANAISHTYGGHRPHCTCRTVRTVTQWCAAKRAALAVSCSGRVVRASYECLMQCSAVPRALAGVSGPMDGFRTAAKSSAAALQNVARIAQVEAEALVRIPPGMVLHPAWYPTRHGKRRADGSSRCESWRGPMGSGPNPVCATELCSWRNVRCARQNEHRCFLLRSA